MQRPDSISALCEGPSAVEAAALQRLQDGIGRLHRGVQPDAPGRPGHDNAPPIGQRGEAVHIVPLNEPDGVRLEPEDAAELNGIRRRRKRFIQHHQIRRQREFLARELVDEGHLHPAVGVLADRGGGGRELEEQHPRGPGFAGEGFESVSGDLEIAGQDGALNLVFGLQPQGGAHDFASDQWVAFGDQAVQEGRVLQRGAVRWGEAAIVGQFRRAA